MHFYLFLPNRFPAQSSDAVWSRLVKQYIVEILNEARNNHLKSSCPQWIESKILFASLFPEAHACSAKLNATEHEHKSLLGSKMLLHHRLQLARKHRFDPGQLMHHTQKDMTLDKPKTKCSETLLATSLSEKRAVCVWWSRSNDTKVLEDKALQQKYADCNFSDVGSFLFVFFQIVTRLFITDDCTAHNNFDLSRN